MMASSSAGIRKLSRCTNRAADPTAVAEMALKAIPAFAADTTNRQSASTAASKKAPQLYLTGMPLKSDSMVA